MIIVHVDAGDTASARLVLDASGSFLRTGGSTVNFTAAEAKVVLALASADKRGLCVEEIIAALGHEVSDRSIRIAQTHISKIRQKTTLIGEEGVSILLDKYRRRYALVVEDLGRAPRLGIAASR